MSTSDSNIRGLSASLALTLAAAGLLWARPARACGEAYSRCASLETSLPPVAPSAFVSLDSFRDERRARVSLDTDYQRRPLVVVVASPDPFGREVAVLSDWLTATLGGDFEARPGLRFGAGVPLSLRLAGTGVAGVASIHGDASDAFGLGDPELRSSLRFALGRLRAGVVQRLSLPLGSAGSFLAHDGPRYAPSLSLAGDWARLTWTLEFGARLRASQRFGDVRFGSEGFVGVGVAAALGAGLSIALEGFALPSLARDEVVTGDDTPVHLRRVAAQVLGSVAWQRGPSRAVLGAGTSLPLTDRTSGSTSERLSGPPGAALRVTLRLEQAF